MNRYLVGMACFVLTLFFTVNIFSQEKKTVRDIPDISLLGNLLWTSEKKEGKSDRSVNFSVEELEIAIQGYLYPSVKGDVFLALHKENGETILEIEEAYISFYDIFSTFVPSLKGSIGLGGFVGKKLLAVGKINTIHAGHGYWVERPHVLQHFFGEEHGLSGEGGGLTYLLPLPIFSQIEVGYWNASGSSHAHAHESEDIADEESEEHGGLFYKGRLFNARLWNSFSLSEDKEFEFGFSYVLGNASASLSDDRTRMLGGDFLYTHDISHNSVFKVGSEWYSALYSDKPGESRSYQKGAIFNMEFLLNNRYQLGAQFSFLGKHGDEGASTTRYSLIFGKQLTDTSKLRLQYNVDTSKILLQFVFGMGPHSHVLQ